MAADIQTSLIFLTALGVDVFLIWAAKSKVKKLMWGCFGVSILLLLLLKVVWDAFYKDPSLHTILLVMAGITAACFLGGVFFAYIVLFTDSD